MHVKNMQCHIKGDLTLLTFKYQKLEPNNHNGQHLRFSKLYVI